MKKIVLLMFFVLGLSFSLNAKDCAIYKYQADILLESMEGQTLSIHSHSLNTNKALVYYKKFEICLNFERDNIFNSYPMKLKFETSFYVKETLEKMKKDYSIVDSHYITVLDNKEEVYQFCKINNSCLPIIKNFTFQKY